MGKQPFPHRMTASLQVEVKTLALKRQHYPPHKEHRRAHHGWPAPGQQDGPDSWCGEVLGDEIARSVSGYRFAKFRLDRWSGAAFLFYDLTGLPLVVRRLEGSIFVGRLCSRVFCRLYGLQKRTADDYFPFALRLHALSRRHSRSQDKCRKDVQDHHEKDSKSAPDTSPVGNPPRALLKKLPLALAPPDRSPPRGTKQQPHGGPESGRIERLGHLWGGRAVSLRNISSRLSRPCALRSSSSDPLATTVPSLMMTAWEQSLVT